MSGEGFAVRALEGQFASPGRIADDGVELDGPIESVEAVPAADVVAQIDRPGWRLILVTFEQQRRSRDFHRLRVDVHAENVIDKDALPLAQGETGTAVEQELIRAQKECTAAAGGVENSQARRGSDLLQRLTDDVFDDVCGRVV